jgi:RNA polymerase sigma-70 factor (ECF subfamily)
MMVEVQPVAVEGGESVRDAFSTVIGRELPSAYRVAGYILADATDAQDAVQEAMERAWNGWPKLRNPDAAKAWFWRILTNVCRDRLAKRRRSPVRDLGDDIEITDPSDPFRNSLLRDSVGRALSELTAEQRIVIVLRFWGQLQMPEIAERLAIPEGTAKSRQHYALETLRHALVRDEEVAR